jgi:hypothetical protein
VWGVDDATIHVLMADIRQSVLSRSQEHLISLGQIVWDAICAALCVLPELLRLQEEWKK